MTDVIDSFTGENRILSNFYPCLIEYEGLVFPSTEHAFQAAKSLDKADRKRFTVGGGCLSAGRAKRKGRMLDLRKDWESVKISVMREILRTKFRQPMLREYLLGTGEKKLVEGNHWGDTFWGVCRNKGQNWLGKLLMEVRKECREQEAEKRAQEGNQ